MDTTGPARSTPPRKKKVNPVLILSIFVMIVGIGIGLYFLDVPAIFRSSADSANVHTVCGPSGHCNDYGWKNGVGYTKAPDNCRIGLWKCKNSDWDQAFSNGCQGSIAYFHKIYSAKDGKGYLKPVFPPAMCGIWQMDVSCPGGGRSFHSRGDRRDVICKNEPEPEPESHNVCDGMACKKVKGKGKNECAEAGKNPAPQCSQRKCENKQCKLVAGSGDDKCKNDNDCKKNPTPTHPPIRCLGVPVVTDVKIDCPLCGDTGD